MKVYPICEKLEKIKAACKELLAKRYSTILEVASVLGLLISNFPAAQFGPLHFWDLDMDKTNALKANKGKFDQTMKLSDTSCADLHWWIDSAELLYKIVDNHTPVSLMANVPVEYDHRNSRQNVVSYYMSVRKLLPQNGWLIRANKLTQNLYIHVNLIWWIFPSQGKIYVKFNPCHVTEHPFYIY